MTALIFTAASLSILASVFTLMGARELKEEGLHVSSVVENFFAINLILNVGVLLGLLV